MVPGAFPATEEGAEGREPALAWEGCSRGQRVTLRASGVLGLVLPSRMLTMRTQERRRTNLIGVEKPREGWYCWAKVEDVRRQTPPGQTRVLRAG